MTSSGAPRIGITLDWQQEGTFSSREHYALRAHYFNVITRAGGCPVGIPYLPDHIPNYLDMLDGLLIPGGFFASPKSWYGEHDSNSPYEESPRLAFDMALIEQALARDMPLLGICAGMQLLGGLFGCVMTPDLHAHYATSIDHINGAVAEKYAHDVILSKNTRLHSLLKMERFAVNSAHREAIITMPDTLVVNAVSEDGIIEGIEVPGKRFAIGVQWHPEFFETDGEPSFELIKHFVREAACAT
jgi:putative glutamine amidotransferase